MRILNSPVTSSEQACPGEKGFSTNPKEWTQPIFANGKWDRRHEEVSRPEGQIARPTNLAGISDHDRKGWSQFHKHMADVRQSLENAVETGRALTLEVSEALQSPQRPSPAYNASAFLPLKPLYSVMV